MAGATALTPAPPSARGLRSLVHLRALRQLVFVRVLSSFGDGAFQGALAGAVLFSPERRTEPAAIAAGFAVLLLPYSIIGPFAGALLDRWSRRRVIVWANLIRCLLVAAVAAMIALDLPWGVLFGGALLIMGVGRFVGSGLSASLPHTVAKDSLVAANSLATTAGAIATAVGGGYAIALRSLIGETAGPMAIVTASVLLFYLGSALLALWFTAGALGPDETDEPAQPIKAVLQGFGAALHHVRQRPQVGLAIGVIMLVRFCFGMCTLVILLLFQHSFTESSGLLRTGLAGIAEVLAVGALGLFLGALITAPTVRRIGRTRWIVILLIGTAAVVLVAGSQFTMLATLITTLVVSFSYQSSKICVDSVVQSESDDAYVGRVFALYDTANNLLYVLAFTLGVLIVPYDGQGGAAVVLIAGIYLLTAAGYGFGTSALTRARR